ncbi:hypothetical protein BWK58_15500, partial [Flavobacterium columnare]
MNAYIDYLDKELNIEIKKYLEPMDLPYTYTVDDLGNVIELFLQAPIFEDFIMKDFDILLPLAEHLKKLTIINGDISKINSIGQFKKLEYLDLAGNPISDFDAISELTNLTYLRLYRTDISSNSRFEFLQPLQQLEELDLSSTNITSIKGLEKLKSLKKLNIGDTCIVHFEDIEIMPNLKVLDMRTSVLFDPDKLTSLNKFENLE